MNRLKLTGPVMLVALLASWRALEHGLIDQSLPLSTMFLRLAVAIALAMAGRAVLVAVVDTYRLQNLVRKNRQDAAARQSSEKETARGQ